MRRRVHTIILSFLATLPLQAIADQVVQVDRIVELIEPSTVAVIAINSSGLGFAHGSGFFVSKRGCVITNRHVIEGAAAVKIKTAAGRFYDVIAVADEDKEGDLVKLKVDIHPDSVTPLRVMSFPPRKGDEIVVIGSRTRAEVSGPGTADVLSGEVSAIHQAPRFGNLLQISAPITSGFSGSPVVNRAGQAIGVAAFSTVGDQVFYFAIPGTRVAQLVDDRDQSVAAWEQERIRNKESSPEFLYNKGVFYLNSGNYSQALSYFQRSVDQTPLYIIAYAPIGYCYTKLERWTEAVTSYKKALSVDPEDTDLYYNLALAAMHGEHWGEAVAAFKRVISDNPNDDELYYLLGESYMELGRVTSAIETYKQGIEVNPNNDELYVCLGMAYEKLGSPPEAMVALKKGTEVNPNNFYGHYNLALMYVEMEMNSQAAAEFEEAVRIKPRHVRARYNLVISYLIVGDEEAARRHYAYLKILDPSSAQKLSSYF